MDNNLVKMYEDDTLSQVFPDEFHLSCLASFFEACAELQLVVNVKNIAIGMFCSKDDPEINML